MQRGRVMLGGVLVALTLLTISTPAAAQTSGSWTLACKGDVGASLSWEWLGPNGVMSSGSMACSGSSTMQGALSRPVGANGFQVTLTVSAGDKVASKTVTKTFGATDSFKVHVSASASERFCLQIVPGVCSGIYVREHEGAQFSLQE